MKLKVFSILLSFFFCSSTFAQTVVEVPSGPITTLEFEEMEFDFGIVPQGDKVNYTFSFTNTGDFPLVLKEVKGSCGCTATDWPKEPVLPGEKGEIMIQFNSKGKKGMQSKRVTITANTDPAQTYLMIRGEVIAEEEDTPERIVEGIPVRPVEAMPVLPKIVAPINEWKQPETKDCFAIFPNPTSEILKLELKEYLGKTANITIFNAAGKKMQTKIINEITDEIIEFDVQNYAAGTYYIHIQIGKAATSTKCFVVAPH